MEMVIPQGTFKEATRYIHLRNILRWVAFLFYIVSLADQLLTKLSYSSTVW